MSDMANFKFVAAEGMDENDFIRQRVAAAVSMDDGVDDDTIAQEEHTGGNAPSSGERTNEGLTAAEVAGESRTLPAQASMTAAAKTNTFEAEPPTPAEPSLYARVIGEVLPGYRRRFARAMVAKITGNRALAAHVAREALAEPRRLEAEYQEAVRMINDSGLDHARKLRCLHAVVGLDTGNAAGLIRATMNEGTATEGPELLPAPILAEIFTTAEAVGVVRRWFRPIAMTNKTLDLTSITTKVTAGWVGELVEFPESDAAFGQKQMVATKLAGVTSFSTEVEEDAIVALQPILVQEFADSITDKEDKAGLLGDGTATYGSQTGVMKTTNVAVVQMAATLTNFNQVTADHLHDLTIAIKEGNLGNPRFVMSRSVFGVIRKLKDNEGRYLVQSPAEPNLRNIWGYPIELTDQMPKLSETAVSTPFVVFGDGNNALFGQRRGLRIVRSTTGILSSGTSVSLNALQQDAVIIAVNERVAVGIPGANEAKFAVIKTAAE